MSETPQPDQSLQLEPSRTTLADIRSAVEQGRSESREKWGKRYADAKEGLFSKMRGLRERVGVATEKGKNALATIEAVATNPDVRRTTMDYVDGVIQARIDQAQEKIDTLQRNATQAYESAVAKTRAGLEAAGRGLKWTADKGKTAVNYGVSGGKLVGKTAVAGVLLGGYGVYKTGEYGVRSGQKAARWTGEQARAGAAWTGEQVDKGVTAGREAYRATSEAVRNGVNSAVDSLNRQQQALAADARAIGNRIDAAWNDALASSATSISGGRGRLSDAMDSAASRFHGLLRGDSAKTQEKVTARRERAAGGKQVADTWRAESLRLRTNGRT